MSCCCQAQAAPLPVAESSCCRAAPSTQGKGGEWAGLAVLVLLSGLAMNLNLAVNISALDGSTRLLLHGALAVAGVVAVLLGGRDLLPPAWRAIRERRIVTEHLFLAGITAAWAVSVHATLTGTGTVFYEVPILLPAIRRFGRILLMRQRSGLAEAAQEMLAGITTARVRRDGGWRIAPLQSVSTGDQFLVKAGETIPADGLVVEGRAYAQTGALTGEPFPEVLEAGSIASAGMVALDGDLLVRATCAPSASEVSHLAASTQALLDRPPAFLRSVEKIIAWFFPVVLVTSFATLIFWAWRAGWPEAIARSLAVVLVACPCAFGVALPLLFRRGLAASLKRGIEPSDGAFMESMSMIRVAAFDKTGTLTEPDMSVEALVCAPGVDEAMVRATLAALHCRSTHPVARPFWRWAVEAEGIETRDLQPLPGRGLMANVLLSGNWRKVRLGHEAIVTGTLPAWADAAQGQRRLFIEIDGALAGVCLLTETLRSSAASACAELAAMGYRVALLTGDASIPAELADAFSESHTAQRPAEKAALVSQWERSGLPALFIGDGLNDSVALATATASIAVGQGDALAASAQARWQRPDFAALPGLCREARALATRANLVLSVALTYNTFGMAAAACGLLHPVAATALMLLSSATVTALAARDITQSQPSIHP